METLLAGWVAVDEGDGLSEYSIRLLAQCQELQQAIVRMLRYRVVTAVDSLRCCVQKHITNRRGAFQPVHCVAVYESRLLIGVVRFNRFIALRCTKADY